MWLIWSIEHDGWWGPDARGYTINRSEAGRYGYSEASEIVRRANGNFAIGDYQKPNECMIPDFPYQTDKQP